MRHLFSVSGKLRFLLIAMVIAAGLSWMQSPPAAAQQEAPQVKTDIVPSLLKPLYLSSKSTSYNVTPYIRLFKDGQRQYSFAQILAEFRLGRGDAIATPQPFFGYDRQGYWMVFSVYNRNMGKSRWILDFGNRTKGAVGVPDMLRVYTDTDQRAPLMEDGRFSSIKRQAPGQERNSIPLTFEPGQAKTIAIYVEPSAGVPLALSLTLEDPENYTRERDQYELMQNALFTGIFILAGIMLLFQWHYGKATPALLLVYLLANYCIFNTRDELLPVGNSTDAAYIHILYGIAALCGLQLARAVFFDAAAKSIHRFLLVAAQAIVLLLIIAGCTSDLSMISLSSLMLSRFSTLAVPIIIAVVGVLTALQSERPQTVAFSLSWAVLLAGALVQEMTSTGAMTYSPGNMGFYWLCFAPHFSLLAFSAIRSLSLDESSRKRRLQELKQKNEEENEIRKTKELADQTRLLGVMQREKELMADLRGREGERIQALRRAKEVADQANKAKSDFLAVISHEIRTPMTGIMGMIRLLLDTQLDNKQKEYAQTIEYAGDGLITLLNDILDFSKVEEGKMTIENVDFDLIKLIESVILLMSGRAEEKKIQLKTAIDSGVMRHLKGDPTRLRQILLNLVSNAIKFTEKGAVTLTVKLHDNSGKKPRIYFAVSDTGIGISEEAQKKLFSPYQQADASISRQFGGTGLGLAICKRLVEAMGSSIQVASNLGQGTTFYYIRSFDVGNPDAQGAAATAEKVPALKILVVDDNPINQRVVSGLLEKDGHKIITAGSADLALNELKAFTFDVILMDMEMPGGDGVSATIAIRSLKDPEKAAVPVIAMTANTRPEDIKRCMDGGMNDYLSKPISPETLRKMLIGIAQQKGITATAAPAAPAQTPAEKPGVFVPTAANPVAAKPAAPAASSSTYVPVPPPPPEKPASTYVPVPPPAAESAAPAAPAAPARPTAEDRYNQQFFNVEVLADLKKSLGAAQLIEMMDGLYQKTEELIAAAEKAIADKDVKAVGTRGHDIKGMTANFGLMGLSEVAGRLERQAKENFPIETLSEIVTKLRPMYYDTRSALDKWIKA